jgi:hypothetical protein
MPGKTFSKACPQCGSGDVRFARKDEEPPHQLVLYRFRKCPDCGVVFLPMSRRANAVFLIVSGILLAAVFIYSMIKGTTVVGFVSIGLALLWPLKMLWSGIRELRRRAVQVDHE